MSPYVERSKRRLTLDKRNGYIAGVCAGFAGYFGIDATFVRVGVVVAGIFLTKVVIGAYLVAWLLLDDKDEHANR